MPTSWNPSRLANKGLLETLWEIWDSQLSSTTSNSKQTEVGSGDYLCKEGLHVTVLGLHSDRHIIWPCIIILALSLSKRKRERKKSKASEVRSCRVKSNDQYLQLWGLLTYPLSFWCLNTNTSDSFKLKEWHQKAPKVSRRKKRAASASHTHGAHSLWQTHTPKINTPFGWQTDTLAHNGGWKGSTDD